MFTDRDAISGAEFPSCWKMDLSLSESGCQTMPSSTAEISCQVGDMVEVECQTESGKCGIAEGDVLLFIALQHQKVMMANWMKLLLQSLSKKLRF